MADTSPFPPDFFLVPSRVSWLLIFSYPEEIEYRPVAEIPFPPMLNFPFFLFFFPFFLFRLWDRLTFLFCFPSPLSLSLCPNSRTSSYPNPFKVQSPVTDPLHPLLVDRDSRDTSAYKKRSLVFFSHKIFSLFYNSCCCLSLSLFLLSFARSFPLLSELSCQVLLTTWSLPSSPMGTSPIEIEPLRL